MHLELTEEQQLVKASVREFCDMHVSPLADTVDQEARFPGETIGKLAEQDLMGIPYPEEYGGGGADCLTYVVAVEELSRSCATTGFVVAANSSLACFPINRFGTPEQKKKFLVPLCRADMLGAFATARAGIAGGAAEHVGAVRDGNEYVINGRVPFVSNAPVAGLFIVVAATGAAGGNELSGFLVPAGTEGLTAGTAFSRMGMRGVLTSDLTLKNCRVPVENMLGREGQGMEIVSETLDSERISIAAQALGMAQAVFDESLQYSKERVQFDKPICSFQAIQWMLANMSTESEVCRLLTYQAAWLSDRGLPRSREAAMAKLMASETAVRHADVAVQIHGGIGTIKGHKVERLYRDVKIAQVCDSSSDALRMAIAASLLQ
ncbi:MAG: acyl-CoA dehydrogenase family protein [Desulfobacteraceae bacterium]|nr:acyl-CoA dehydrogenase family protein [Desulfobacteraceae bacterium]